MHGSPLGYRIWVLAIYLLTTGIKGTSSMKLHRDLRVTQKTAWFLAHRIRETWGGNAGGEKFTGPVEADEAYFGGTREANKHSKKKLHENWMLGKTVVGGVKDRTTGKIRAGVIQTTDAATLTGMVFDAAAPGCDGLHGRGRWLSRAAEPRIGEPQRRPLRRRSGAHERDGVVLEPDETWLPRYVPPHERRAPAQVHRRVRGEVQRPADGTRSIRWRRWSAAPTENGSGTPT